MEGKPKKETIRKKPAVHPRKPRAIKPPAVKPETVEKPALIQEEKPVAHKVVHSKHYYALGRRKTAVAQAQVSAGTGTIVINELPFEGYFQTFDLQQIVTQPLRSLGLEKQFNVRGKIHGGGIHAQAESMRHAISRALILLNPESRRTLKKLGFLTRDPRVKERKKPGLKRARRAPQFSKR